MYPGEEMISFPAEAVLSRWQAEGFAPSHVMLVRKHNQVMVLVSQLDAHNVGLFREWSPAGNDEDELLRQIARDYRTTKDAVARMPARAWWDQMAIWRFIAQKESK
jgi:hypothetical protein